MANTFRSKVLKLQMLMSRVWFLLDIRVDDELVSDAAPLTSGIQRHVIHCYYNYYCCYLW